jgi:NAD(P)-dependent dehydrogenase (short-subunit alcohol dehydrogenase family)
MSTNLKRFEGQTAIVTGGAKGIGKAVVERLAAEGAAVTIFDNDQGAMSELCAAGAAKGARIEGLRVDITDEAAVQNAIGEVASKYSRLDVMVNSAGIIGPNGVKIHDVAVTDFKKTIEVNLIGSFLMTKHSIPHMLKRGYGRILLIASVAGKEGNPKMVSYSSSKGGVIALARAAAKEYADAGITVNALCPATVLTPMVESMDPKVVEYMKSKIPMGRFGTLEEVASVTAFYVSPEASFITAQALDHTGGRAVS